MVCCGVLPFVIHYHVIGGADFGVGADTPVSFPCVDFLFRGFGGYVFLFFFVHQFFVSRRYLLSEIAFKEGRG